MLFCRIDLCIRHLPLQLSLSEGPTHTFMLLCVYGLNSDVKARREAWFRGWEFASADPSSLATIYPWFAFWFHGQDKHRDTTKILGEKLQQVKMLVLRIPSKDVTCTPETNRRKGKEEGITSLWGALSFNSSAACLPVCATDISSPCWGAWSWLSLMDSTTGRYWWILQCRKAYLHDGWSKVLVT